MTFSRKRKRGYDALSNQARELLVQEFMGGPLEFVRMEGKSKVIVRVVGTWPVEKRGQLLMALERTMREHVDPSIEIFLEPHVDKNKLRQLRGVDVQA